MGALFRLPAQTVQQAAYLPAGGAITLTNRDVAPFYYLVKTSGGAPTYAEVLAGTAVAAGATATKALSAKSWVWIASAAACDVTITTTGLDALEEASAVGAVPFWSWLFRAVEEDVVVQGTFLDRYGLAVGAGMGDQEPITSSEDASWPQIYGIAGWAGLDYRSIASAIVTFSADVRARPGLNFDGSVRGAVEPSDLVLPAGSYVFGALAGLTGVQSLGGSSASSEDGAKVRRYVFAAASTATMTLVLYDAAGLRVYAGVLTVTTTIASLPNLIYSASDDWPETAVGGKIIAISGGAVYFDIYGDGTTGAASNGPTKGVIDGDFVPTIADMEAVMPGFRFGRLAGGGY